MQRAYATSPEATKLLAEAQIILSTVRHNDAAMPATGTMTEITLGTPASLDVLVAPRSCEMHVTGHDAYTIALTPRADTSIQALIAEALDATAKQAAPQPAAPKPDKGF